MYKYNLFFALSLLCTLAKAQPVEIPVVGQPLPDYVLTNVKHHKKATASFRDFKGKWLLIDYWYAGCRTCIRDLPRLDNIQKQFRKELQILLVGCSHPKICYGAGIEDTYEGLRKKLHFDMIAAFDSNLVEKWEWYSFPRMIIADPDGIVRVITDGSDLTSEKLKLLFNGDPVTFHSLDQSSDVPVGEGVLLSKSILRKWNGEPGGSFHTIDEYLTHEGKGYKSPMISLTELYNMAYTGMLRWQVPRDTLYGQYSFYPMLETKDSTLFKTFKNSSEGYYYYELVLTGEHVGRREVMETMQRDLRNTFGFEVSIERREMPVWKLVATEKARAKLRTKGGTPYFSDKGAASGVAGFTLRNVEMIFFMALVKHYINDNKYPYFDETGINGRIDITFNALMTDFSQVKSELKRNGLDLIVSEKLMNVIVIRDGK